MTGPKFHKYDAVFDIVAEAYDAAGNHGTAAVVLNVFDPSDTDPPVVAIGSVGDDSNRLTAITSVVGSVSDPDDNIIEWSMTLVPKDGGKPVEVATGTDEVDDAALGSIDTTNIRNGLYTLVLSALDAGGNVARATRELEISADLKLGNYTVSFTDLSVAVGGMSIVVSRSYNTLNADTKGEFGYGWSLDLSNTKVEVKYPAGTDGSTAFEGTFPPFRDGTRVIITLPDGKREGFTFYGAPGTQFFGHVFDWIPKFIPDYGVTDELFTDQPRLIKTGNGVFVIDRLERPKQSSSVGLCWLELSRFCVASKSMFSSSFSPRQTLHVNSTRSRHCGQATLGKSSREEEGISIPNT